MQQEEIEQPQTIFYRKADKIPGGCSKNCTFDLRFERISDSLITQGFCGMLSKVSKIREHENKGVPTDLQELEKQLPIRKPDFQNSKDKIKYTWIGHSTAVISIGQNVNLIIDPVFSERASPVGFAGPKRFRKPAASLQQLPQIDAIFISHDHYDHLDSESLQFLHKKNQQTLFFAGLQSEDAFPKQCKLKTLDWTQSTEVQIKSVKFKITFVPVCHWSRRGLNDQNKRLWGGYVIQVENKRIFYAGDTAYCEIFEELGKIFGPFDLAILPIGAYEPRDFLKSQHVNPEQSVQVHKDLRSKKSVGVHWGTFPLGYEHYFAARQDLEVAKKNSQLKEDQFITVDHGGSFTIDL